MFRPFAAAGVVRFPAAGAAGVAPWRMPRVGRTDVLPEAADCCAPRAVPGSLCAGPGQEGGGERIALLRAAGICGEVVGGGAEAGGK